MVDHDIVRLDVSVHNAHAVAVIQCAQQLIEITLKGRFSMVKQKGKTVYRPRIS